MRKESGFTLVELMVAVALIGILAASTMPGFSGFLNRQKLNVTSNNVYTAMQYAKASAIQQNSRTTLVFDKDTANWCVFNRSIEPNSIACSWTNNVLETGVLRKYIEPLNAGVTIAITPAEATQITFDSLGRLTTNPDLSASLSSIAVTMETDTSRASTVQLTNGLVRLCNPKKPTGDPQAC